MVIEWSAFEQWVYSHLAKNYAGDVIRYSKKYADVMINNNTSRLLLLSKDKQRLVMAALSNLSKFLGVYQQWKEAMKNVGLKWSKADSFDSFIRIMNNNHNDLIQWYNQATENLEESEKLYLRFMLLSGLRKNEGIQSFNLIIELYKQSKLNDYYNEELSMLQHYKYKQFLRQTKNVYVSFVDKNLIFQIANSKPITYEQIRKRLSRNNIKTMFKELRSYYASYMAKHGLISEEVDLLQGRIGKTVFAKHYLKENPKELSDRVLSTLKGLEESTKRI